MIGNFRLTLKFWKEVLIRSIKAAFGILDIRGHVRRGIITLLAILLFSLLVAFGLVQGQYLNTLIRGGQGQAIIFTALVIFVLLIVVINIPYIPAKMYKDLGGFDELNLVYKLDCAPPRYSEAWVTMAIHNESPKPFRRCFVILESVEQVSNSSRNPITRPEKLAWSSAHQPIHEDKDIPPLESMAVDIVRTDQNNNRIIFTTRQSNPIYMDKAQSGDYVVRMRVEGIYGNKRHTDLVEGRIRYEGGLKLSCNGSINESGLPKLSAER